MKNTTAIRPDFYTSLMISLDRTMDERVKENAKELSRIRDIIEAQIMTETRITKKTARDIIQQEAQLYKEAAAQLIDEMNQIQDQADRIYYENDIDDCEIEFRPMKKRGRKKRQPESFYDMTCDIIDGVPYTSPKVDGRPVWEL